MISPGEDAKAAGGDYATWWSNAGQFVIYWKLDGISGGPYVAYYAEYMVFHSSTNITAEGCQTIDSPCYNVEYSYTEGESTQELKMFYETGQTGATAQYCGFSSTQEGYQFVNWSVTYPDGTTGILSPGENINFEKYKGSSDPTFKLTANFAQPKLIVIPDNISVEKGGSYTLGYTAIGLDTSKYTMNLSWKSEGSSAKVGVYTIEISVISFIDKATQQHVDNPYDTKLYDGTLTVYEGDHSTLVT